MATAILASASQYRLPESDRRQILSTIPPIIQYPNGVVPDSLVQQNSHIFPKFIGRTNIHVAEMEHIMHEEVALQQVDFFNKYGDIFG